MNRNPVCEQNNDSSGDFNFIAFFPGMDTSVAGKIKMIEKPNPG